jgi:hypothetical protein
VFREVDGLAAHRVDATSVARTLQPDFQADLAGAAPGFDANLTALVAGAVLLHFVLSPLVRGGYLGVAVEDNRRLPFAEFVRAGGATYWKFFRTALLGVLLCYLLSLAARPLLTYMAELTDRLGNEVQGTRYVRATEAVVFAAFVVLATILDYCRVGIRLHRRPGVLAEFGRSTLFVLQHPGTTLSLAAVSVALEVGVIALFVPVLEAADGAYLLTSCAVLLLVQILVMLREGLRLFHLACAWRVRAVEFGELEATRPRPPPREPDLLDDLPWSDE